ncbi:MAG TPA: peptidylprolyl isomerase [Acidimicrobiales bacterium]|nr:peptidylprolyl isomerase [Acidimicrobiales bacterium]
MPSEKRARQRAYRDQKRAIEEQRRRRRRALRRLGFGGGVVVVVLGLIVLFVEIGSSPSPKKSAVGKATTTSQPTTTLAPPTTVAVSQVAVAPVCPPATAGGAAKRVVAFTKAPPMCISPTATFDATFKTTAGNFVVEMPAAESPAAVNNFVFLARYHFFDGTSFPRVAPGFVIQGGSPNDTISGGPGYSWTGNLPPASCGKGGSSCYPDYSLAVANSGSTTSNGSQFFIVLPGGGAQLQRDYTRFGQVISGFKAVDQIAAGGTTASNAEGINGVPPKVVYYIYSVTISEVGSTVSTTAVPVTSTTAATSASAAPTSTAGESPTTTAGVSVTAKAGATTTTSVRRTPTAKAAAGERATATTS